MIETIFYDGHCGLCHSSVRFVLRHDQRGAAFRFAPLQGTTYQSRVPLYNRSAMPDSIAVLAEGHWLLVRSDACVYIGEPDWLRLC
jgi:predicted DCC family thiol-disulfide oxidoreductase YuxK